MTTSTTGSPSNSLRFCRSFFLVTIGVVVCSTTVSSKGSGSKDWTGCSNRDSWFGSRRDNFSLLRPKSCRFSHATWASSSSSLFCNCSFCRVSCLMDSDWLALVCWSVATKSSNVSVRVIIYEDFEQYKNKKKLLLKQGLVHWVSLLYITFS